MAIKMRFLHYPDNKKLSALCKELSDGYDNCSSDRIPPAYPSERERFTVILIKTGKELTNELNMFCGMLSKERTQNVLYVLDAPDAAVSTIVELTQKAGAKVVGEPVRVKFPGIFGGFSEEVKATIRQAVASAYEEVQK